MEGTIAGDVDWDLFCLLLQCRRWFRWSNKTLLGSPTLSTGLQEVTMNNHRHSHTLTEFPWEHLDAGLLGWAATPLSSSASAKSQWTRRRCSYLLESAKARTVRDVAVQRGRTIIRSNLWWMIKLRRRNLDAGLLGWAATHLVLAHFPLFGRAGKMKVKESFFGVTTELDSPIITAQ